MLELLEQQKKLTANQWKIAGAATLGDMLDFFDFFLIGFVLAFVVKDWHLNYGQSGAILLASGVSAPFGSLLYGWMADKIGRRTALITAVLNVSLATGAMALTPEGGWIYLVICRFFVGFAVTGLYSVDITLMQEFSPAHKRGWFTGVTTTMLPAGSAARARCSARSPPPISAGAAWSRSACCRHSCASTSAPSFPNRRIGCCARAALEEARRALAWALQMDPGNDRPAGRAPADRKNPLARNVQISAQHHRRLPDRADPDRRRRAGLVAGDAVGHGAEDHARPKHQSWSSGSACRRSPAGSSARGSPTRGDAALPACSAAWPAALFMSLAGYLHSVFIGGVSMFFLMILIQNFFGSGNYSIVGPYMGELWPARLRGSGMGFVYGVGNLGKFIGPAGLALIAGSSNFVSPRRRSTR